MEAQKHVSSWLTKPAKSQLSPLEMFSNNPTDLLPFLQTDIDLNSKVELDFVASNVGLLLCGRLGGGLDHIIWRGLRTSIIL